MLNEVFIAGIEITFSVIKSSMQCSVKIYHGREKRQTRVTVTIRV